MRVLVLLASLGGVVGCGGREAPTLPDDADGDGFTTEDGDCNDLVPVMSPGGQEICDGIDNDCDGAVDDGLPNAWYYDRDGDGYGDPFLKVAGCLAPDRYVVAPDCDDDDPEVHGGAPELCNGLDDDCDGVVDNVPAAALFADLDGDGYGDPANLVASCDQGTTTGGDCDDGNSAIHPGMQDGCNGVDEDCDGAIDENPDGGWYRDGDGDGVGSGAPTAASCEPAPAGLANAHGDCNDANPAIHPGSDEHCDGVDEDCDGDVDDDAIDGATFYGDSDGDGHGDPARPVRGCSRPAGTAWLGDDCDDVDGDNHPGANERCDGADNDCDTTVDEPDAVDAQEWFADDDHDGWGDAGTGVSGCDPGGDATTQGGDCDDSDGASYPTLVYADLDLDGFGDDATATPHCGSLVGLVTVGGDCVDGDNGVNPGRPEVCNDQDDDCDGGTDVGAVDATAWYADGDGDGFGNPATGTRYCDPPLGRVQNGADCRDLDPLANPNGVEVCDNVDNDCDGAIDWGLRVPAEHATVSAAMAAATSGDTICIAAGTFEDNLDLGGKDLTLQGAASSSTFLDGGGAGSVVIVDGGEGLTLRDLTVRGGLADNGAGIFVSASALTLEQVVVEDNECTSAVCNGTGVYALNSTLLVSDSEVRDNTQRTTGTGAGVGIFTQGGSLQLDEVRVRNNTFTGGSSVTGAGLATSGTVAIFDQVDISATTIELGVGDNHWVTGGGFSCDGPLTATGLRVMDTTVSELSYASNGNAVYGAGLYLGGGASGTIEGFEVSRNAVRGLGGLEVNGVGIADAFNGGFTLSQGIIADNSATTDGASMRGYGGGVRTTGRISAYENVSVVGNSFSCPACAASVYGGGIWSYSGFSATNLEVSGNSLVGSANTAGAAIQAGSTVSDVWDIDGLIVAGNTADAGSGVSWATVVFSFGTATLRNADLVGNVANGSTSYGGALLAMASTVALRSVNVVGNNALAGGALYSHNGAFDTAYSNFYDNGGVPFEGIADPVGTGGNVADDPLYIDVSAVDPLAWDLRLQGSSPVMDLGDPSTTDADGSDTDIGAYGGQHGDDW